MVMGPSAMANAAMKATNRRQQRQAALLPSAKHPAHRAGARAPAPPLPMSSKRASAEAIHERDGDTV
jgi:hypothetical protein